MSNRRKTQSPESAKSETAKGKTVKNKSAKQKTALEQDPAAFFEQFNRLWQEKWQAMLREKGWPEHLPFPSATQMPAMAPFMLPAMMPVLPQQGPFAGAAPPAPAPEIMALAERVAQLEQRIMELERQLPQRSTGKAAKSRK